jgi:hypothetical protein
MFKWAINVKNKSTTKFVFKWEFKFGFESLNLELEKKIEKKENNPRSRLGRIFTQRPSRFPSPRPSSEHTCVAQPACVGADRMGTLVRHTVICACAPLHSPTGGPHIVRCSFFLATAAAISA